ncbi:hypothetical protein COT20_02620 [bacterium (Candidatus Gribaldobacteria) CG08_land_8_20_14_0_20_39_15]|uniref:Plasmid stabilization protein n=1 Tax=bacterium (Candidatus Gribaldobacteria) CG08_land_8_20_14_0_20_39_15 TaxID=2014273 RepID=A0A2M6XU01_9BACT|nr:MAG: hypothetical protein COT20_02620 [bacterium (Candidatus Gribaldobacteria) CG08_land_8_20_14_0_20_39_15]
MKVFFKNSFIKDFQKLSFDVKKEVRRICLDIFPRIKGLIEFQDYSIKEMQGFKSYYRIRVGHYRIGFKKNGEEIIFMRVLARKDIYKFFP